VIDKKPKADTKKYSKCIAFLFAAMWEKNTKEVLLSPVS